jgi:outer membrane biosynthesis protein TonB
MTTRRLTALLLLALLLALVPGAARAAEPEFHAERQPAANPPADVLVETSPPAEDPTSQEPEAAYPEAAPRETPESEPVEPEAPPSGVTEAERDEAEAERDEAEAEPDPAQPTPQPAPAPDAVNRARTVQVIVQVQVGCRHHCDGTTQSQTAVQEARTEQTAVAPGAEARNESTIEQHVWQLQLGCVFFCTATVQSQTVVQTAVAAQTADGDEASNTSAIRQTARQAQTGRRRGGIFRELRAFLRALSLDTTVTLQVIRQVQIADCRAHCSGGSQVQLAVQQALVVQVADPRGYD